MIEQVVAKLKLARSVVLSTHRQCDGDGLGAQLALFHALRKSGVAVRMINVDRPARKYGFLGVETWLEVYESGKTVIGETDLALILDTNDGRLVEPLFSDLKLKCRETLFIDHHPVLAKGPQPTLGSLIDITAASTGELCYHLLKAYGVEFDTAIARALYTSLVFDTQLFRYVKAAPASHLMAADLLKYEREPEEIHRRLFACYTVAKMRALMRALERVEYLAGDRIAFIPFLSADQSLQGGLDRDESGDIIDQVMNIESIEIAALLREDGPGVFKLSLRSRGTVEVLSLAESFGGGGHRYASGAHLNGDLAGLRARVLKGLEDLLPYARDTKRSGA